MGNLRSGHGTKRPDHSFVQGGHEETGRWEPYPDRYPCCRIKEHRKPRKYHYPDKDFEINFPPPRRHQKSLFSDKLDPSLHGDRLKRANYSKEELMMRDEQRKKIAIEAKDIQTLARKFAIDAMETLAGVMQNPEANDTCKITAANSVLDRAYGKPAITNVNLNSNLDASPKELDSVSLDQRIEDTLAKLNNVVEQKSEETKGDKRPIDRRKYN